MTMSGTAVLAQEDRPCVDTYVSEQAGFSSPLVDALERAWSAIRAQHPEVPAAVLVLGAGSVGVPAGALKLGHFAAGRWSVDTNELPEVFVGGEGLSRGAVDVLGTLLHEAAHGLAHARGVKDCSRQGRYHNRRYAALAQELGLEVQEAGSIGWSATTGPPALVEAYAGTLAQLGAALTLWRRSEQPAGGAGKDGRRKSNNGSACTCGCGRRIRVAASVLAAGPITCGVCGEDFTAEPTDDDEEAA